MRRQKRKQNRALSTQVLSPKQPQQRTIVNSNNGQQVDVSGNAYSAGYKSIPHVWFQRPRDLPPFSFMTIRGMLLDPGVRLNFATRVAPLFGAEFGYEVPDPMGGDKPKWVQGVKCARPEIAEFIYRQIQTIWTNYLPEITRSQVWGWSAGEVTLKLSDAKLIEINSLLGRHASDCRLLKDPATKERWGVSVTRVEGPGSVLLPFPYAWFHSYNAEDGDDYGVSAAIGAYSPWADKWFNGGALDVRRLFMHKDAYGGLRMGYPEEDVFLPGVNQMVPAQQIAQQITEQIVSGGTVTYPSTRDEKGYEKWPITDAKTANNPQHILQYPKDLDDEIRHGMEISDAVLSDDGAWAGKRVTMAAFYASLDHWIVQIVRDLKEQIINHLLLMNFGYVPEYEICAKPLAKQAMEQQANAGPGSQQGQADASQSQVPGMASMWSQPAAQPQMMSLEKAIGAGDVSLYEALRDAAKAVSVMRMSTASDEVVEPRKFSSTQFNLPTEAAQLIRDVAAKIPDDVLAKDGREDEPHITIKYGIHDDTPEAVKEAVANFPPVRVRLGKASIFQANEAQAQRGGEQYDVVKIDVESEDLHKLNALIANAIPHTDTHPEYQPHITIAYVQPGYGEGIAAVLDSFDGLELTFDQLVFSDKERNRILVDLNKGLMTESLPDESSVDPERFIQRMGRLVRRMFK